MQQVGEVTSKYGNQGSKGPPTTVYLSTTLSHRMADEGVFTVYAATHTMFLACCKDSAKFSSTSGRICNGEKAAAAVFTITKPTML